MSDLFGLNLSLGSLPLLSNAQTRSISAENPTGGKGAGAQAIPDPDTCILNGNPSSELGKGWKVKPCINLKKESTFTLAEIEGPGIIQHIWFAADQVQHRNCILRFYWDNEGTPSIEVPLGDFFANGHCLRYRVNSLPISVNPNAGVNSYWPMPFKKNATITIENQDREDLLIFYQITYALTEVPEKSAYFHAQWRRSHTKREKPEHTILDNVIGQGHYVGTALAWVQMSTGLVSNWWGEGEIKFFIDGDQEDPTICGTGTEDYFGGSGCFGDTYSTPFLGYPLWHKKPGEVPKHGLYRWHILDPIRFSNDLKVTIQALGWWPNLKFEPLTDDIASVAYWYQAEPHNKFPDMLSLSGRFPR